MGFMLKCLETHLLTRTLTSSPLAIAHGCLLVEDRQSGNIS